MDQSPLGGLPNELLESIVFHLPLSAAQSFGTSCKRATVFTQQHLIWRRKCASSWRYWPDSDDFPAKLRLPPAQVKWRQLYDDRIRHDEAALALYLKRAKCFTASCTIAGPRQYNSRSDRSFT